MWVDRSVPLNLCISLITSFICGPCKDIIIKINTMMNNELVLISYSASQDCHVMIAGPRYIDSPRTAQKTPLVTVHCRLLHSPYRAMAVSLAPQLFI
jgi:hypothetical protein